MGIDTVLLIVILTFGIGFVLNRWDRAMNQVGMPGGIVLSR